MDHELTLDQIRFMSVSDLMYLIQQGNVYVKENADDKEPAIVIQAFDKSTLKKAPKKKVLKIEVKDGNKPSRYPTP